VKGAGFSISISSIRSRQRQGVLGIGVYAHSARGQIATARPHRRCCNTTPPKRAPIASRPHHPIADRALPPSRPATATCYQRPVAYLPIALVALSAAHRRAPSATARPILLPAWQGQSMNLLLHTLMSRAALPPVNIQFDVMSRSVQLLTPSASCCWTLNPALILTVLTLIGTAAVWPHLGPPVAASESSFAVCIVPCSAAQRSLREDPEYSPDVCPANQRRIVEHRTMACSS
jgi:hypothetical protein